MLSGANARLVFIGILTIGAAASLALLVRQHRPGLPPGESCAVYRSFYDQVSDKKPELFRPTLQQFRNDNWRRAPTTFERDTGEVESIVLIPGGEPFKKAVREKFEIDTSSYFNALAVGDTHPVVRCFESHADRPEFSNWPFSLLHARQQLLRLDPQSSVAIWTLSPVGFSEDGLHALLYAETECGGWCGAGGFFLFEKQKGAWILIGDHWIWVA